MSDLSRDSAFIGTGADGADVGAADRPLRAEIVASIRALELAPTVTICSPTFAGVPAELSGTIATAPRGSRVGAGWRELGGSLPQPAPLTPGDAITVPEVDDAATLSLTLASAEDAPTTVVRFTDLAPGPSTVRIGRDARGLVGSLTRGDGTTAEAVGTPTPVPSLAARFKGTAKRWRVSANFAPGTLVVAELSSDDYIDTVTSVQRVDASGRLLLTDRPGGNRRAHEAFLTLLAVNRDAQTVGAYGCSLRLRRAIPRSARCAAASPEQVLGRSDATTDLLYGRTGTGSFADAPIIARTALRFQKLLRGATTPTRLVQRRPVRGRAAATATPALVVRPVAKAATSRAPLGSLRPLAADVNGDGATDFWTDQVSDDGSWSRLGGGAAGIVLISGPGGLTGHRVDIPLSPLEHVRDSEISAISDITGDGVGELVVDVDERHTVIPGSRTWTGTTAPIRTADLADLDADQIVLAPSVSSPGAPYATLDDVTGDGLRELSASDDSGGWYSLDPTRLTRGAVTRLPSVARTLPLPDAVFAASRFDRLAPRVDPRLHITAGVALSVQWPVVATRRKPLGVVQITPRNARGAATAAPTRVQTPGNAILLDHDRGSGELLLLAVKPSCTATGRAGRRPCVETMLRVRANGTIRQTLRSETGSIVQPGSARFLPDGPDADGELDVVLGIGSSGVGTVDSTESGAIAPDDVPVLRLGDRAPFYDEVRPIPVFGADGSRKVFVMLTDPADTKRWGLGSIGESAPAELVRQ